MADRARHCLIAVPFAGSGTQPFLEWREVTPDLCCFTVPILPGRETRFTEPFPATWDSAIEDLCRQVQVHRDHAPVVIGHSLGGWLAADLVARLEAQGQRVRGLVVSGASVPGARENDEQPQPHWTDRELSTWLAEHGRVNPVFWRYPEMRGLLLDLVRHDLGLKAKRPGPAADGLRPLRVPVVAIRGESDPVVSQHDIELWRSVTGGPFGTAALAGGHFFHEEAWRYLPKTGLDLLTAIWRET